MRRTHDRPGRVRNSKEDRSTLFCCITSAETGSHSKSLKILKKTHPADLALLFKRLEPGDRLTLLGLTDNLQLKSDIMSELDSDVRLDLFKGMDINQICEIIPFLESDDTAEIFRELPPEITDEILKKMKADDAEQLVDLLGYPSDSAGGIMNPEVFSVEDTLLVKDVIELLQKTPDVELAFYIYVVNESNNLLGVLSMRKLLLVKPETPISAILCRDVICVKPDVKQEEVARIVARYDLLAVPVVDDSNNLLGAVTVDDVIDVIKEEATDDMMKMAGVGGIDIINKPILSNVKSRIPWLLTSAFGGIIAFLIIRFFEQPLSHFIFLAAFIPLILGTSGNIGTQTSTIIIRSLALGTIPTDKMRNVVVKELLIGCIMGFILGSLIGAIANFLYLDALYAGFIIGISVLVCLIIAAMLGAIYPLIFNRLKIDPALATGPFITTSIDVVSILVYFHVARAFLKFSL